MGMALVFGGGGGKGSYEIGVWKALRELGWENKFDCIIGTSVGALNALLYGQGSYEHAYRIWNEISNQKIMATNDSFERGLFSQKGLDSLIRANITGQLKKHVYVCCAKIINAKVATNEKFMQALPIAYLAYRSGLDCRSNIIDEKYEAQYFKINDYDRDTQVKLLLASAAIPIAFPEVEINGSIYRDGGTLPQHNVPYRKAIELGYKNVLAVSLDSTASYFNNGVYTLSPSKSLGENLFSSTMDFESQNVSWRINLGYADLMSKRKDIEYYIIKNTVTSVPDETIKRLKRIFE